MNELMIVIDGNQWIYFKTNEDVADKALARFLEVTTNAEINLDNVHILRAELRNEDGEIISVFSNP